jgi:hypothetical protein
MVTNCWLPFPKPPDFQRMNVRRIAEMGLLIEAANEQQLQMLGQLPFHADASGNKAADRRLYPGLIAKPDSSDDFEANRDWADMVGVELRKRFANDADVVASDLCKAQISGDEQWDLLIRFDHVAAWFSTLNQARLVMHERFQFPDLDDIKATREFLQSQPGNMLATERFFTFLQSALIALEMDREAQETPRDADDD